MEAVINYVNFARQFSDRWVVIRTFCPTKSDNNCVRIVSPDGEGRISELVDVETLVFQFGKGVKPDQKTIDTITEAYAIH